MIPSVLERNRALRRQARASNVPGVKKLLLLIILLSLGAIAAKKLRDA